MTKKTYHLLVIDDDLLIHQSLKMILPPQWRMFSATRVDEISWTRVYHAALVDMHLDQNSSKEVGTEIVADLAKMNSQLEIIAMSGDLRRELMETCLKAGAGRFIGKPFQSEELVLILRKIEAFWEIRTIEGSTRKTQWIGDGGASQKVMKWISEMRGEQGPILLEGETGTGKDVVARLLHEQEGDCPFIPVNIGGIPDNLFESELFGHLKGAFTGADTNKMGLVEAAHGGYLFLDEIEALPLSQQVKLLRFLETGEIRRVGSKDSQFVNVKVIAASNRSLEEMVRKNEFREDLYFRLISQRFTLPRLKDRKEDIHLLAKFFIERVKPKRDKMFLEDGIDSLRAYPWPGNVRELKRVCEQLSLISPLPFIRGEDVSQLIRIDPLKNVENAHSNNSNLEIDPPANFSGYDFSKGLVTLLTEFEIEILRACLKTADGVDDAAEKLKISRSSLYKKIKDFGLET